MHLSCSPNILSSFSSTAIRSSCSCSIAWSRLSTCLVTSAKIFCRSLRLPTPPDLRIFNSSWSLACVFPSTVSRPVSSFSAFCACFSVCSSCTLFNSSSVLLCMVSLFFDNDCSSFFRDPCASFVSSCNAACASSIAALISSALLPCSASSNFKAA